MEMKRNYMPFFGFEKEPFTADIAVKEILRNGCNSQAAKNRFDYTMGPGCCLSDHRRDRFGQIHSHPLFGQRSASFRAQADLRHCHQAAPSWSCTARSWESWA